MQSYKTFTQEQKRDPTRVARVKPIANQIMQSITELDLDTLVSVWHSLMTRVFSQLPSSHDRTIRNLRTSLLQLYVVTAFKRGQKGRVVAFFETYSEELTARNSEWRDWLALPYLKSPQTDPRFEHYFTNEWAGLLEVSLINFFETTFQHIPLPSLLSFNLQRLEQRELKSEIRSLRARIDSLEFQLALSKQNAGLGPTDASNSSLAVSRSGAALRFPEMHSPSEPTSAAQSRRTTLSHQTDDAQSVRATDTQISGDQLIAQQESGRRLSGGGSGAAELGPPMATPSGARTGAGALQESGDSKLSTSTRPGAADERIPYQIMSQIVLKGHTGSVTCCRFSGDGRRVASGGTDGTLRVWNISDDFLAACPSASQGDLTRHESQEVLSKHRLVSTDSSCSLLGTEFCRSEVGALEWDGLSDDILLYGTHNSKIKLWSAKQKKVLRTTVVSRDPAGCITSLACSPNRPVFVAALSSRSGENDYDETGQPAAGKVTGRLMAINLQTGKHMQNFDLGGKRGLEITSTVFNHNGNMVLTSATDGVVRIFETSSNKPIMAWPAHMSKRMASVRFSGHETTVLSCGLDGNIYEWSLHKIGKLIRTYKIPCTLGVTRFELALHPEGTHFVVSGTSVSRIRGHSIYDLFDPTKSGVRTSPSFTKARSPVLISTPENKAVAPPEPDSESKMQSSGSQSPTSAPFHTYVKAPPRPTHGRMGVAYLYSKDEKEPVQTIYGHSGAVTSVHWHPDLNVLSTCGNDATTRITTLLPLNYNK